MIHSLSCASKKNVEKKLHISSSRCLCGFGIFKIRLISSFRAIKWVNKKKQRWTSRKKKVKEKRCARWNHHNKAGRGRDEIETHLSFSFNPPDICLRTGNRSSTFTFQGFSRFALARSRSACKLLWWWFFSRWFFIIKTIFTTLHRAQLARICLTNIRWARGFVDSLQNCLHNSRQAKKNASRRSRKVIDSTRGMCETNDDDDKVGGRRTWCDSTTAAQHNRSRESEIPWECNVDDNDERDEIDWTFDDNWNVADIHFAHILSDDECRVLLIRGGLVEFVNSSAAKYGAGCCRLCPTSENRVRLYSRFFFVMLLLSAESEKHWADTQIKPKWNTQHLRNCVNIASFASISFFF